MLDFRENALRTRHDKVILSHNSALLQAWNAVNIHETCIKHGYHLALSTISGSMHLDAIQRLYLFLGDSITVAFCNGIPTIEFLFEIHSD